MRSIPAISAALLLATACREPPGPLPAAHSPTPIRGGTLRLASFTDMRGLDPATVADGLSQQAVHLMFAGLVDYDTHGQVIPDLAEHWDVASDGMMYTFTLRQNARFHDGEEVTADDIKRSVERALAKDTPSGSGTFYEHIKGYADYHDGKTESLEGVRVEGKYVVSFALDEADATFLPAMGLVALRPVCKSGGRAFDDSWQPCGAGPFKLSLWDPGRSATFVRHDGYFRPGLPYLDAVQWTFGMNAVTQRFKLETGELEINRELLLADMLRYQSDPRWSPYGSYDIIPNIAGEIMNVQMPPFDNVEVRRAVAAAIDRNAYHMLRTPNLLVLDRALPPNIAPEGPFPAAQHYNLAEALEHMKRAGYPYDPATGQGGYPTTITYLVYRQGLYESGAQIVQQMLAKIGIRIEIKIVGFPTYAALTRRRKTIAIAPGGWAQDYPDASDFLEPVFTTSAINDEDSNNLSFYSNPELDGLLKAARHEVDGDKRKRMYVQADAIVCNDAPWAFTHTYRYYVLQQSYVKDLPPHPMWYRDATMAWLDRGARALTSRAGVWRGLAQRSP